MGNSCSKKPDDQEDKNADNDEFSGKIIQKQPESLKMEQSNKEKKKKNKGKNMKQNDTGSPEPVQDLPESSGMEQSNKKNKEKGKGKGKSKTTVRYTKDHSNEDIRSPPPGMAQTADGRNSEIQAVSTPSGQTDKTNTAAVMQGSEVASSSSTPGRNDKEKEWTQSTTSVHSTTSVDHVKLLEKETKQATDKRDSLKEKEKYYERELENARRNEKASKEELTKLAAELNEAKEKRKEADQQVAELKKQSDQVKEQLTIEKQKNKEEIDKLQKEKEDGEKKRQELEKEKLSVENALEELKKREMKDNSDVHRLQKELAQKDRTLRELETKANMLKLKETEIQQLRQEKDELYLRLSAMAGRKLTDNNPNIADLSDTNRPTKLAEQYSQLYDNEWTEAFEYLETLEKYQSEKKAISVLFETISIAYDLTLKKANGELGNLNKAVNDIGGAGHSGDIKDFLKQLKDFRRKRVEPGEDVQNEYAAKVQEQFPDIPSNSEVSESWDAYRSGCLKICWLMVIQDPPVYLECGKASSKKGDPLDKNKYKEYTVSGVSIDFPVWPAMYLQENGSVLCKGVVQCVKKSSSIRGGSGQLKDFVANYPTTRLCKSLIIPSTSSDLQAKNDEQQMTQL